MYCKHCGKEIADDSKFCKYCGNKLDEPSESEQVVKSVEAPSIDENKPVSPTNTPPQKGNRLGLIFLWSILICAICTIGYAAIRSEDSQPCDSSHPWGTSAYDPTTMMGGDIQGVYEDVTWIRKDEYESGIKKTAIYSFPISFGILVLGAILTGTMNKKQ